MLAAPRRGWEQLYVRTVTGADTGADQVGVVCQHGGAAADDPAADGWPPGDSAVWVSALSGEGIEELRRAIGRHLEGFSFLEPEELAATYRNPPPSRSS